MTADTNVRAQGARADATQQDQAQQENERRERERAQEARRHDRQEAVARDRAAALTVLAPGRRPLAEPVRS